MAVSFYGPVKATKFAPIMGVAYARSVAGLVVTARSADPFWAGTLTTPNLSIATRKGWLAWLSDCVDRNLRVTFVHPQYRYPEGYDETNWPLGGDPVLVSVTDRRTIVVSGLQIGMVLPQGTRLSVMQGGVVAYRYLRAGATVASTTAQSLQLGPRLPSGVFLAGATVRFALPPCQVMVVPESWEADEDIESIPLTFDVMEAAA